MYTTGSWNKKVSKTAFEVNLSPGLTSENRVVIGVPFRFIPNWLDNPIPPIANASPARTWFARNTTTTTAKKAPASAAAIIPTSIETQGLVTPHSVTAITA